VSAAGCLAARERADAGWEFGPESRMASPQPEVAQRARIGGDGTQ
jgi:hypothetical protein